MKFLSSFCFVEWVSLVSLVSFRPERPTGNAADTHSREHRSRGDPMKTDRVELVPSNALVCGDELEFYYTGIRQYAFVTSGRDPGYDDYYPDAGAVCLANLRKDGFISVDAAESGGSLLTQSFELRGSELMVNVACRKKGQRQAELLSEDNSVLATTIPLEDNKVATKLAWNDNGITKFVGQQVRLRFTLKKASLYSYWIE